MEMSNNIYLYSLQLEANFLQINKNVLNIVVKQS